jgi:hypothetical protein
LRFLDLVWTTLFGFLAFARFPKSMDMDRRIRSFWCPPFGSHAVRVKAERNSFAHPFV